jgi:hypothetical protein
MRDYTERDWYAMSISDAYRYARSERIEFLRRELRDQRTPELVFQRFQQIAGKLSHSECIVAQIEFNAYNESDYKGK